ncbi:39S ribosomal L37, mitochondrial [Pelobates cultripes]|uniref:Large ribosomal subunit protein mL37 n=1 Tax=Pelobates cultripes TaxID=61616 RepID=A0AAD1STB9_PELCU|nr:39S ribosomal L37, mitochondrial [Pelobates cultripes]
MAASILPHAGSCLRSRPGLRCLSLQVSWGGRVVKPVRKEPLEIPGLERITYADRMYHVPWLARPTFPEFRKDWADPGHYRAPPPEEMELYRERPSYVFHRSCRMVGGVKQALWLTKSKLIEGLPERILSICNDPAYQFSNHEQLVHNLINQACIWNNKEEQPTREEYCPKLLQGLLHLCRTQNSKFSALSERSIVENCRLATFWKRGSDTYHVRGINGFLMSAKSPLTRIASDSEIQATEQHTLESLYPIAPAIDLQEVIVYEERNDSGFKPGYPFTHPHTLFLIEPCSTKAKFSPDQLRAKMIMLAYGSALAKARSLYGDDAEVLEQPIVVQSIATDGQLFQFMTFQLNTMNLASDDGVKNLVWMDSDQALYDTALRLPKKKRRVVVVPAGISGFQPATFLKFWAMYLHGTV